MGSEGDTTEIGTGGGEATPIAEGFTQPEVAPDILVELWAGLAEPATITNAFRFTNEELGRLTDVVYELSKRHSTKLAKQDVVRLALGSLLHEYTRDGDYSLLGRYVLRKKQWRRGRV